MSEKTVLHPGYEGYHTCLRDVALERVALRHEDADRQRLHERLVQEANQAHTVKMRMMLWAGIPMLMLVATICLLLFRDVKTALIVLSFFSGGGVGWTFNEARRKTQSADIGPSMYTPVRTDETLSKRLRPTAAIGPRGRGGSRRHGRQRT